MNRDIAIADAASATALTSRKSPPRVGGITVGVPTITATGSAPPVNMLLMVLDWLVANADCWFFERFCGAKPDIW
jgi:hypothetical protein